MKKRNVALLICCVVSIAVTAWSHFATAGDPPLIDPLNVEVDPVAATAGGNPGINYSTGFEPEEGFPLGYISNAGGTHPLGCGGPAFPCWGHTTAATASLITPTIENINPASGVQHLRLIHDSTTRTNQTGFGLGVDARYPRGTDLLPRPVAPNTVSVDIAISAPFGQNFRVQPQSNSQGSLATSVLFFYTGDIYIMYGPCKDIWPVPTGFRWDTTGGYQNFTVAMDPCEDNYYVDFYYGGELIYTGCSWGSNLEQFLVFGDNYPGSYMDVDNVVLESLDGPGFTCGNGIAETCASYTPDSEECDGPDDDNCPGRCIPPGKEGECTCATICTQEEPCPVVNGENGPFVSSSGFYVYSGDSPFISVDGCGTDFDAKLWLGVTDEPGNGLVFNSNCQQNGSSGANSDPSAPCYAAIGSQEDPCACVANPGGPVVVQLSGSAGFVPLGSLSYVNIRKKSVCAGNSVGACCDTNGPDFGCTDNVLAGDCTGSDKVWIDQGKCEDVVCECIPDCTGRVCGDDGCGGSCGTCDDGNVCNGSEPCSANGLCNPGAPLNCNDGNVCNGVETCNPNSGCVPGTPPNCDDGEFCNGTETCVPPSGCASGTPPCAEDETCDEESDECVATTIPTVSDWGLVVLALVLLVGAKLRFGPRTTPTMS